ncbi:MAG: hypothetical protein AAFZ52_20015 [Bacteroidota bacterium]
MSEEEHMEMNNKYKRRQTINETTVRWNTYYAEYEKGAFLTGDETRIRELVVRLYSEMRVLHDINHNTQEHKDAHEKWKQVKADFNDFFPQSPFNAKTTRLELNEAGRYYVAQKLCDVGMLKNIRTTIGALKSPQERPCPGAVELGEYFDQVIAYKASDNPFEFRRERATTPGMNALDWEVEPPSSSPND